jgi:hypothetical protein
VSCISETILLSIATKLKHVKGKRHLIGHQTHDVIFDDHVFLRHVLLGQLQYIWRKSSRPKREAKDGKMTSGARLFLSFLVF